MSKKERVIMVTEDPLLVRLLADAIDERGAGLSLQTYALPSNAILDMARRPVSTIMTDLALPLGTGFVMLHEARARTPDTPVIAVMPRESGRLAEHAFETGAFDVVWKPAQRVEIAKTVDAALGVYRLRQRLRHVQRIMERWRTLRDHMRQERGRGHVTEAHVYGSVIDACLHSYAVGEQTVAMLQRRLDHYERLLYRYGRALEEQVTRVRDHRRRTASARLVPDSVYTPAVPRPRAR